MSEWISVEDRLPRPLLEVVLVSRVKGVSAVMPARFDGDKFMVSDMFCRNQEFASPTHWMPLPEPPNTEQE